MKTFQIKPTSKALQADLQHKIDFKTKPLGALGLLEKTALKIGLIQQSDSPQLNHPAMIVFAGDHGLAKEGVSAFPQEVTFQMVMNFLHGGAAINVFCKQHGIDLKVVDAGVNYNFDENTNLISRKIGMGTASCLKGPAMTRQQCEEAFAAGDGLAEDFFQKGSNIIGFGEMGIGNTSAASLVMSKICGLPIEACTGRGTGLDDEQLQRKTTILQKALDANQQAATPLDVMAAFGGFEMAMMCGAMLGAAERNMTIMIDGFIATAVFLVAHAIHPEIMDFAVFCHQSNEQGHRKMLEYLKAEAILKLDLRLGEGTGCALAYPLIESSVRFLNEMASFEDAGVSNKE